MKLPPNKWTFKYSRMQKWIKNKIDEVCEEGDKVLNLFAGITKLKGVNEYRVELVPYIIKDGKKYSTYADWHGEGGAEEFIDYYTNGIKAGVFKPFKVVLLDPPYNLRKAREKYENRYIGSFTKLKNKLNSILHPNARVITWGYSSVGMSKKRGYKLTEILLVCHSGDHNDTLVTVEDRIVTEKEVKN